MTTIESTYGNKVRIRVCGVLKNENKILLVNHKFLNSDNIFWNFPGGGLENGESIEECLKREFLEETNLAVGINELLFFNEFLHNHLHSIELYFRVSSKNIETKLGIDPEFNILTDLRWFRKEDVLKLDTSHYPSFITKIAFT